MESGISPILGIGILAWTLFWKALALWRASKYNQKNWFIAMLILNTLTLGILEVIYLFRFAEKRITIEDFKKNNFLP